MKTYIFIALLVAVPFLIYIWIDAQRDADRIADAVNAEQAERPRDTAPTAVTETLTTDFVPQGYRWSDDMDSEDVLLDVAVLAGSVESLQVEYGQTPDGLTMKNTLLSNGLGMGEAGVYGQYTLIIDGTTLEAGREYFYRIVGTKADDSITRSGYASFMVRK